MVSGADRGQSALYLLSFRHPLLLFLLLLLFSTSLCLSFLFVVTFFIGALFLCFRLRLLVIGVRRSPFANLGGNRRGLCRRGRGGYFRGVGTTGGHFCLLSSNR